MLINDIVARPAECAALVKAYEARAVCVANTFRCKIPHMKAFFAVLTDERNAKLFSAEEQRIDPRPHSVDSRRRPSRAPRTKMNRSTCSRSSAKSAKISS